MKSAFGGPLNSVTTGPEHERIGQVTVKRCGMGGRVPCSADRLWSSSILLPKVGMKIRLNKTCDARLYIRAMK